MNDVSVNRQILLFLFAVGFNINDDFTDIYDSHERGAELGRSLHYSIVICGVLALFY